MFVRGLELSYSASTAGLDRAGNTFSISERFTTTLNLLPFADGQGLDRLLVQLQLADLDSRPLPLLLTGPLRLGDPSLFSSLA